MIRIAAFLPAIVLATACFRGTPPGDPAAIRADIMSEGLRLRPFLLLTDTIFVERCALFNVLGVDSLSPNFPESEVRNLLQGLSTRTCGSVDSTYATNNQHSVRLRAKTVSIKRGDAVAVFQVEWTGGSYLQRYRASARESAGRKGWVIYSVLLDKFVDY